MKEETHIKAFNEHKDAIDWSIDRGVEDSQRIIGMHSSRAIVELLSVYLHKINKIESGFQINHRWFKSQKVYEKFPNFPNKNMIFSKMIELENMSENIAYSSDKPVREIEKVIKLFNELKILLERLIENAK